MPVRFGSKKQLYMRKILNLQFGWAVTSNKKDCAVFVLVDILFTESFFKKGCCSFDFPSVLCSYVCSVSILSLLISLKHLADIRFLYLPMMCVFH